MIPWILEHLLAYPGSYEIPLRTMYTLNSAPHAQAYTPRPGTPALSNGSSPNSCPTSPLFPPDQQYQLAAANVTENFKSNLMNHISQLPSQPCSLPPAFITSFVRRCFTDELHLVDFTQALTALDYLKDLENRRKKELGNALQRLGVDKTYCQSTNEILAKYPGVSRWIDSMQIKERKVEALYTQVYIGLRRWVCPAASLTIGCTNKVPCQTLINEMRLEPFNKANCIAMLNTLYPPTTTQMPTSQLTPLLLSQQRSGFFRYIQCVERNGKVTLSNLEHQGQRPNDSNGWAIVRETVDKYLRTANGVIEECVEVVGTDSFDPTSDYHRHGRRADSGVSFATADRPSTSGSTGSKHSNNKPLPASPPQFIPPVSKKKGSTLEKIAREIKILRSRTEAKENARKDEKEKVRILKKMKSTGTIGGRSQHSRTNSADNRAFDIDELQRQRMIIEATREKENRTPSHSYMSHEV